MDNDSSFHLKKAVDQDFETDSIYLSDNEKDTCICYDFKERRGIPTSYSLSNSMESSDHGRERYHLGPRGRKLIVEATRNFKISKDPSESSRFFRLKQAGKNH